MHDICDACSVRGEWTKTMKSIQLRPKWLDIQRNDVNDDYTNNEENTKLSDPTGKRNESNGKRKNSKNRRKSP